MYHTYIDHISPEKLHLHTPGRGLKTRKPRWTMVQQFRKSSQNQQSLLPDDRVSRSKLQLFRKSSQNYSPCSRTTESIGNNMYLIVMWRRTLFSSQQGALSTAESVDHRLSLYYSTLTSAKESSHTATKRFLVYLSGSRKFSSHARRRYFCLLIDQRCSLRVKEAARRQEERNCHNNSYSSRK